MTIIGGAAHGADDRPLLLECFVKHTLFRCSARVGSGKSHDDVQPMAKRVPSVELSASRQLLPQFGLTILRTVAPAHRPT